MTTPAQLAKELADLAKAATSGPWYRGASSGFPLHDADGSLLQEFRHSPATIFADAALIVALVNNLPAIIEALDKVDEIERVFDAQWEAGRRATKRWQEAHPGNDNVWPDRADMVVWLMDRHAEALGRVERLENAARSALKRLEKGAPGWGVAKDELRAALSEPTT